MPRIESTMAPLGTRCPAFSLHEVATGGVLSRDDFRGRSALLVMFLCRHCPFVKHLEKELAALGRDYAGKDIALVGISSNDAEAYPEDDPASLKEQKQEAGFPFPYLYDETQEVARAFGAACTPDFFLYDRDQRLVYRGQFDNSRPGNGVAITGEDLREAIDTLLAGRPIHPQQRPSVGCGIKWKHTATAPLG